MSTDNNNQNNTNNSHAPAPSLNKGLTRAKKRYLNKRKQKRKAKLKSKPKVNKKRKLSSHISDQNLNQNLNQKSSSSSNDSSDSNSDSDSDDNKSAKLKQNVRRKSESSSSSSDSDSDSDSGGNDNNKNNKVKLERKASSSSSSSDSSDNNDNDKIQIKSSRNEDQGNVKVDKNNDYKEDNKVDNDDQQTYKIKHDNSQKPISLLAFPEPENIIKISDEELSKIGLPDLFSNESSIDSSQTLPTIESNSIGISNKLKHKLIERGFNNLFAVQLATIPLLLKSNENTHSIYPSVSPRDICVSAPTGSGKTLGYVLPIIDTLSKRLVTRLRALIILPTRDLVTQVRETFEVFTKGTDLKIGTITGQHSFPHEQSRLVDQVDESLEGGSSKVDILIATPGRLIDHLNSTPNFTLQHLRYLVIDEADRLLNQSFQSWIDKVQIALTTKAQVNSSNKLIHDGIVPTINDITFDHNLEFINNLTEPNKIVQKMLFSATITTDPAKIRSLHLHQPHFISVGNSKGINEEYAIPHTLKEIMIVSDSAHKPLMLLHLLYQLKLKKVLCFTKSVENANRLMNLIRIFQHFTDFQNLVIESFSSDLSIQDRNKLLNKFKKGEIDMLVCSDIISRGIDIQGVENVINYDIPLDMPKYVHRVGRTARAGLEGNAYTLVEEQEAKYFKNYLKHSKHFERIKKYRVNKKQVEPMLEVYDKSLEELGKIYT